MEEETKTMYMLVSTIFIRIYVVKNCHSIEYDQCMYMSEQTHSIKKK